MEVNDLDRLIREQEGSLSLAFPALMRKVYVWMIRLQPSCGASS